MAPPEQCREDRTAETDIQILERALEWESAGAWPWRSMSASLMLHSAGVVALFAVLHAAVNGVTAEVEEAVTRRFVPLISKLPAAPKQPAPIIRGRASLPPESSDADAAKVTVNFTAIGLDFERDGRNQLPAVVESQSGMLALAEKKDGTLARYLMRPPDWEPLPVMTDLSRKLRFHMRPARAWPVFRDVAGRYGIDLDQYEAYAVFDSSYRRCLDAAIRSWLPPHASGRVASARLAFATDSPCGVVVRGVSFATNSGRPR